MKKVFRSSTALATGATMEIASQDVRRDYQAYEILHWGFTALPILAGLDKFAHVLANWNLYLSPQFNFFGANTTMHIVGIVEIVAGLGVALLPRIFAPVVAVWLWGIIANLLLLGGYYDIALRDFGLSLGAIGLWRLSQHFSTPRRSPTRETSKPDREE